MTPWKKNNSFFYEQLHVKVGEAATDGEADTGIGQLGIKSSFVTGRAEWEKVVRISARCPSQYILPELNLPSPVPDIARHLRVSLGGTELLRMSLQDWPFPKREHPEHILPVLPGSEIPFCLRKREREQRLYPSGEKFPCFGGNVKRKE